MKTKEKNKSNPFVGLIGGDEEILWVSGHPAMTLTQYLLRLAVAWMIPIVVITILSFFDPDTPRRVTPIGFLRVLGCWTVVILPIEAICFVLFNRKARETRSCVYMLTNKAVYAYTPEAGSSRYGLEHVHEIYTPNRRTIMFEANSPASQIWKNVDNAQKVAALMEQTRVARLDDLYLYKDQAS